MNGDKVVERGVIGLRGPSSRARPPQAPHRCAPRAASSLGARDDGGRVTVPDEEGDGSAREPSSESQLAHELCRPVELSTHCLSCSTSFLTARTSWRGGRGGPRRGCERVRARFCAARAKSARHA